MRNSRKIVRMLKGAKSGAQLANELGVFDKTVYRAKARVLNISSATKAKTSKPQRNVFCGPRTRNQMIADDYMQGMSSWGVGLKYGLGSAAMSAQVSATLKQLQSRQAALGAEYAGVIEEQRVVSKKQIQIQAAMQSIEKQIKELSATDPVVSEHALLRYLERAKGT